MRTITFVFLFGMFTGIPLQAHVDLNSPLGGETYHPGDTMLITWAQTIQHNTLNWDLYYSDDGGLEWNILKEDIPLEERSYVWIVPEIFSTRGRIKIVQDNEGEDYESSSQNFTLAPISSVKNADGVNNIRIYPNPLTDHATIEFGRPEISGNLLLIYDSAGVLVKSVTNVRPGKIDLKRGNLTAGIYILRLSDGRQVLAAGKFVIR